jgi:hypothetical protein
MVITNSIAFANASGLTNGNVIAKSFSIVFANAKTPAHANAFPISKTYADTNGSCKTQDNAVADAILLANTNVIANPNTITIPNLTTLRDGVGITTTGTGSCAIRIVTIANRHCAGSRLERSDDRGVQRKDGIGCSSSERRHPKFSRDRSA